MQKFIISLSIIFFSCDTNINQSEYINDQWLFVANEGNLGASNGSVTMIDGLGNVYETEALGDVVQSLEVWKNKLIVLVNNSHTIKFFDITSEGLSMPGIEVSTDGSGPREMVIVNDKIYFTNSNSSDVKVFNLFNYNIESSISVGPYPEGIIYHNNFLWVANSGSNTISKININNHNVTELEVGEAPQYLATLNDDIYVSSTFYDEDWNAYHSSSKITELDIIINNYGLGLPCGGSILNYQNKIYRSYLNGIAPLNDDLEILSLDKIQSSQTDLDLYHAEIINGKIWLTFTNFTHTNLVIELDSSGNELNVYESGIMPGDISYWHSDNCSCSEGH